MVQLKTIRDAATMISVSAGLAFAMAGLATAGTGKNDIRGSVTQKGRAERVSAPEGGPCPTSGQAGAASFGGGPRVTRTGAASDVVKRDDEGGGPRVRGAASSTVGASGDVAGTSNLNAAVSGRCGADATHASDLLLPAVQK